MDAKNIVDKLRKLINLERSERSIGNIAAAETFAGKIQELLTSHKLSMSEVDFQEREAAEPIDWERIDLRTEVQGSNRVSILWRVRIARAIADANSCQVVNAASSRGTAFFFVGRTSDREMAKILYIYLIDLAEEMAAKSARENREVQKLKFNVAKNIMDFNTPKWAIPAFNAWLKSYRESWKLGFGDAVSKRIIDQYKATLANAAASAETAIIHINRDALAVKDFLKGQTKKQYGRAAADNSSTDGYNRGKSTGEAINLSPNRFSGTTGRTARLLGA